MQMIPRLSGAVWAATVCLLSTFLALSARVHAAQTQNAADSHEKSGIRIFPRPDAPFIEKRRGQQLINFDLLVRNNGQKVYTLVGIRLRVYDSHDQLELERELNENGKPPALDMVGSRLLRPGAVIDIFQPFYSFGPEIDLGKMRLELLFMEEGHSAPPVAIDADEIATVDVRPRRPPIEDSRWPDRHRRCA